MNLVKVLEAELRQFGVERLFGIPGDFVLPLFEALQNNNVFPMLHLSHEPSAVFAADACARLTNKPSAVILTYGAGALNAVNAIAQSYVEHVPLVVIAGFPAQAEIDRKLLIHHQAKTVDSQQVVLREVTCCQVRLNDPASAAADIRKALAQCAELSRPVLIEFPRDVIPYLSRIMSRPRKMSGNYSWQFIYCGASWRLLSVQLFYPASMCGALGPCRHWNSLPTRLKFRCSARSWLVLV